ncbi:MAG TPA: redoxin domain-containing protein [Polyangia bacterium]|nr:redoxin domain-containing protein [Polyangia bacterium]
MVLQAPPPPASGIRAHGLSRGAAAPELDIPATDGSRTKLADHRGSPVVLVFYPGDFTPVCTGELGLFNELLPELQAFGAKVFAISCDSLWSHVAYAKELSLRIPLLTDFHPKGEVCRRFDVYRDDIGTAERALFVLDGDGRVFWSHVSPIEINPGADGVLVALEQLTGKDLDSALPTPQAEAEPPQRQAQGVTP